MSKDSISKTAQVNLQMLSYLGVPEAVRFNDVLKLEGNPLFGLEGLPMMRRIPMCISAISEVLYESANQLIIEADNPTILDLACGYSPRVLLMAPRGYTYIGADLPDVTADLIDRRQELVSAEDGYFAGYRTVDVTDREQMEGALAALRESITVVTQGLLSYLNLDEKNELALGVKDLLTRDGGCWIIPDAEPSTMLKDTFRAVLGSVASSVVVELYRILDKSVKRNRSKMGWQSADEIADALESIGFSVRRVPLYREGLELRCLKRVGPDAATRLVAAWEKKSSLVVTLPGA